MPELLSAERRIAPVAVEQRVSTGAVLKHYVASAALYGLLLAVLILNPWYKQLLSASVATSTKPMTVQALAERLRNPGQPPPGRLTAIQFYKWLYVVYLGAALPAYLILRPRSLRDSKNVLIWGVAGRAARSAASRIFGGAKTGLAISTTEKSALMFLLVKMCFGPLMLNSAFLEIGACQQLWSRANGLSGWILMDFCYIMFVHLIFLLDSCLFFFGYHTESGLLRNKLKAVDTNLWRILVCIMCYAPFNMVTITVLGPSLQDPYIIAGSNPHGFLTWLLRGGATLFLLLLISSSLSLFTRASNLTNRGIVTWGPYRFVRHPGYFAKNLFWLMTIIPVLIPNTAAPLFSWSGYSLACLGTIAGLLGWGTIYFLRSVTEEQFLMSDPDYVAYCKRVPYRFIPGVY